MKGTVYSGLIYLPSHPQADVHGQIRCVVRTQGITNLTTALRRFDIPFSPVLFNYSLWSESKSAIEQQATERHYGVPMVCPTWCQYLKVENYSVIPSSFMKRGVA